MLDLLQAFYTETFPDRQGPAVTDLTDITAGWESELHAFTLEYGPAAARRREELILRLYPGDGAPAKATREFHNMRLLRAAGYPVPEVYILELDRGFGKPFLIMERIRGQLLGALLTASSEERQRELLTVFCRLFVRLHELDWRPFNRGAAGQAPVRCDGVAVLRPCEVGDAP